jgi:phospholipid/cholesterol/gamma-HCH transport system substrate-binding protein
MMETRANYVLIGLFTLAVVIGAFGFVYWFQNIGGHGGRAYYKLVFDGSVSGLRTGGTVLFNGIRVGEVTALTLDPQKPQQVIATVAIDKSVAVRPDTEVGLEFQGLTGIASLSLKGGSPDKPALVGAKDKPPLLTAPAAATQDIAQAARETLRRLDSFIAENQQALHGAIVNIDKFSKTLADNSQRFDAALDNIDKFSGALARNSDRIDKIAQGLQNLTGGADGKSGEINAAAKSIQTLADHLDARTAQMTSGVNQLTRLGTRQIDKLSADAQRTLATINRTISNIDRNPSRLIFGGSGSAR